MRLRIFIVLVGALTLTGQVSAADAPRVAELFGCTFNEGKNWDDFEETNAFFAETVKKIGGKADDFDAFVWQPFRADLDITYLWNGYYANLATWGEATQAYLDSPLSEAADDKWGELETCGSALVYVEQIYDSESFPPADRSGGKAMLESFRCNLQPGKNMGDVRAAIETWHEHISSVNLPIDVFMRTPLVSTNGGFTHTYFAVHENAAAYGANVSRYQADPGTAAIDALLGEVQQCTNALWQSWQVIDGDAN